MLKRKIILVVSLAFMHQVSAMEGLGSLGSLGDLNFSGLSAAEMGTIDQLTSSAGISMQDLKSINDLKSFAQSLQSLKGMGFALSDLKGVSLSKVASGLKGIDVSELRGADLKNMRSVKLPTNLSLSALGELPQFNMVYRSPKEAFLKSPLGETLVSVGGLVSGTAGTIKDAVQKGIGKVVSKGQLNCMYFNEATIGDLSTLKNYKYDTITGPNLLKHKINTSALKKPTKQMCSYFKPAGYNDAAPGTPVEYCKYAQGMAGIWLGYQVFKTNDTINATLTQLRNNNAPYNKTTNSIPAIATLKTQLKGLPDTIDSVIAMSHAIQLLNKIFNNNKLFQKLGTYNPKYSKSGDFAKLLKQVKVTLTFYALFGVISNDVANQLSRAVPVFNRVLYSINKSNPLGLGKITTVVSNLVLFVKKLQKIEKSLPVLIAKLEKVQKALQVAVPQNTKAMAALNNAGLTQAQLSGYISKYKLNPTRVAGFMNAANMLCGKTIYSSSAISSIKNTSL